MKKKVILFLASLFPLVYATQAQDSLKTALPETPYKTAVGLQVNRVRSLIALNLGFSLKHYINSRTALELNLNNGSGPGVMAGSYVLVQKHYQPFVTPGLRWYAGAGINLDLYRYTVPNPDITKPGERRRDITPTIIGNLGLEYKFPKVPFTISGDLKAGLISISSNEHYRYSYHNSIFNPNISIRYILGE